MQALNKQRTNILDIFATDRPSLVTTCKPISGVSDHEIVHVESRVYAKYQRSIQHNICLWKKADIINLKSDILDAVRTFIEVNTISTKINSLWEHFSKTCQELIDKHAPSKITSVRYSQTWINTEIKRHSRQKKKAYNKAKASKKTNDWDHYKSIKKKCQIECRKAYNNYVSTMLNNNIKSNPKRLWSFNKSKRCNSTGIAPLSKGGNNHSSNLEKNNILNDQFT